MLKVAFAFWKRKVGNKNLIIRGKDFPNEYARRTLLREDLAFPIRKDLYFLKNKGEEAENLVYQFYWPITENLLKIYEPWSIEKESALALHLGDESIPRRLLVRTSKKTKYLIVLPFGLEIQIRPDISFQEKTRQSLAIGNTKVYLDIPEKILFSARKRRGTSFVAFIRGMKFNRRFLEILYSENPKPIVVKELMRIAEKLGRSDLSSALKKIFKEYTIYRL